MITQQIVQHIGTTLICRQLGLGGKEVLDEFANRALSSFLRGSGEWIAASLTFFLFVQILVVGGLGIRSEIDQLATPLLRRLAAGLTE